MCEMATAERGADAEALTRSMVWPTERSALLAEPVERCRQTAEVRA